MRSLYLRFFLSFWTSMVLVLAFTIAATLWLAAERQDREHDLQDSLAREASMVLSDEGVPALHDWLVRQVTVLQPDRLFLLDAKGVDLLGRPVPAFVLAAMGRRPFPAAPRTPGRLEPEYRMLSQLRNPQTGETYALSLQRPRTMSTYLLGMFATPETPAVVGIITLLVSVVVCYLLARQLSKPIQHLRNATRSIADGDLGVRVADLMGARRDELANLAVDFDMMSGRLRALLESQQQLLRDVSHELRSPLARLQIALGLARRPGANLAQELDRIEQEAQRLDELIGEILSLSRLDDPARAIEAESVSMAELLEPLVEDARIEADTRAVTIELDVPQDLELHGDRELLHRAVENVVRNAVRFSPDGACIAVQAQRMAGLVQLAITDQGPGVPPELLQRIFEPFFRVASARERDSGGNGIGLAIAARVLSLHGGSITAANVEPHGLRITLQLPATAGLPEPRSNPAVTASSPATRAAA
jgi:two-component system sensor histidine kinase CpxA